MVYVNMKVNTTKLEEETLHFDDENSFKVSI